MRYTVRKSVIDVVGRIWMPAIVASSRIVLTSHDIENMRDDEDDDAQITRESVEMWLSTHAGDFQEIIDFSASIEDGDKTIDIPFATEDGESAYLDTLSSDED